MKRSEYYALVTDFEDLREFCDENGLDACDDIVSEEEMNDELNRELMYCILNWQELRDALVAIQEDQDWYIKEDDFVYLPADRDVFAQRQEAAFDDMDLFGFWDPEDDEDDEADEAEWAAPREEHPTPMEEFLEREYFLAEMDRIERGED